jgi:hypothetical protein
VTGFSIAVSAWGIHTVLHGALAAAESEAWASKLQEAAARCAGGKRSLDVVVDIRGIDGAALTLAFARALSGLIQRPDVGRCAVVAANQKQVDDFCRTAGGTDPAQKVWVFAVDGRDRLQIASAYNWALNAAEPRMARRIAGYRSMDGNVIPFAKPVLQAGQGVLQPSHGVAVKKGLRKAS